jgi:DNA polymerase/3'-5' exonuclease PolX
MKKEEAIKEFEGACRKFLWGEYMEGQKLLYVLEITEDHSITSRANREYDKTMKKLYNDYMDVLEKVRKAGLSHEKIEGIKERIGDEVNDILLEMEYGRR